MIDLARLGGPVACFGLAVLLVARSRRDRIAGLGFAVLGACVMAAALAPDRPWKDIAEIVVAVGLGALLAVVFRRLPWLLPLAALATVPVRIGALGHQLLVPLYLVILGGTLLFAWQLVRGDERSRELRVAAWPLALYVGWTGLSLAWTGDVGGGAIEVLAFYIPLTMLALLVARLPWSELWLRALYVELGVMALIFAAVGFYQYDTRNVFENPKVINSNAYAAYFRVNSVFWDPSIYGRFLVIAIIPSVVLIVRGRSLRLAWAAAAVVLVTWLGLLISFSQSSFAALLVAVVGVAIVAWRWRSAAAIALVAVVLAGVAAAQPQIRRSIVHHTHSGLNSATSGRASLVANGIRIAEAHPVTRRRRRRLQACVRAAAASAGKGAEGGGVARRAGHGGGGDRPDRARPGHLAGLRGDDRRLPPGRPELPRTRLTRLRTGDCCDPVPLALLQRLLRGPDDLDAVRLRRAGGGAGRRRRREGGAGVIEQWRKAVVLAPHTDDGEFGCGGTMARLADAGCDVRYVAFSIATRSLPEGFPPDTLAREVREATAELGIPEDRLTVHDFDVRTFPERRQDILELLVALWEEWQPDVVFQPSLHDIHQDHQTIAEEGLRAFKRTTILGYEIPWNNFQFSYQWYVSLEQRHIERKIAALERYASQQHRRYADPEYVRNLARTHGINVNREYAEVFQVYRVIA